MRRSFGWCVAIALIGAACSSTNTPRSAPSTNESPLFTGTVAPAPASSTTVHATSTTLAASDVALASLADVIPHPEHSPADDYARVPTTTMGTIRIPAIGLTHQVYEGVWLTIIDIGPGHWPGTAWPGAQGNAVFPGHRVTHSHPFLDLDKLRPGDEIFFDMPNGTFTYRVRETRIVAPSDIWVVDQHANAEVTLIACHPKHSARQRIVIKGDLVASQLTSDATNARNELAELLLKAAS